MGAESKDELAGRVLEAVIGALEKIAQNVVISDVMVMGLKVDYVPRGQLLRAIEGALECGKTKFLKELSKNAE